MPAESIRIVHGRRGRRYTDMRADRIAGAGPTVLHSTPTRHQAARSPRYS